MNRCEDQIAVYGKNIRCQRVADHGIMHKAYIYTRQQRVACLTWSSVDRPRPKPGKD